MVLQHLFQISRKLVKPKLSFGISVKGKVTDFPLPPTPDGSCLVRFARAAQQQLCLSRPVSLGGSHNKTVIGETTELETRAGPQGTKNFHIKPVKNQ